MYNLRVDVGRIAYELPAPRAEVLDYLDLALALRLFGDELALHPNAAWWTLGHRHARQPRSNSTRSG